MCTCECVSLCVFTHAHMYMSVHDCVCEYVVVHTQARTEWGCEPLTTLKLNELKEKVLRKARNQNIYGQEQLALSPKLLFKQCHDFKEK